MRSLQQILLILADGILVAGLQLGQSDLHKKQQETGRLFTKPPRFSVQRINESPLIQILYRDE